MIVMLHDYLNGVNWRSYLRSDKQEFECPMWVINCRAGHWPLRQLEP
jgi:hypothetical protein